MTHYPGSRRLEQGMPCILAHRLEKLESDGQKSHPSRARSGVRNISELLRDVVKGRKEGWSPLWNSSNKSEHPATPGLWVVQQKAANKQLRQRSAA